MHPLVDELTLSRYLTHGTSVLSSSLYSVAFFLFFFPISFFFALVPIINGEGKIRNIFEIGGLLLQSFYN
ncbi:CFC_HP_G0029310.mRNA.1.CDS.1 [Saccharomyces cerevisiae]|nr:CFC_HP_G0058350.mRNA.1.CDS.1 [Saccharomyces cerevisiae]CAI5016254.1 CFC_HP_G0015030.mRNA.1.CDS.1 [Saccharomyces cerevisiae]CAI5017810.1 CFC_HP_G0016200.mRNA.1.CDS.1 [Saccharomyces cerevisiae]CAI5032709.1 CFC_HP_G0029310.mRNA.1.CDS.1 [Saccharomyces cerevisiae]CAI6550953.1 CFC_HP_G0058350.mRNA.1.CDS.1 [Saccharomyces cerevisiae]